MAACAISRQEKKIDEQIASEPPANEPGEMAMRGALAFALMPGLSESQRQELLKINLETANKAQSIQTEIRKAKSVLYRTLATPDYDKSDIEILKKKIVKLDLERLDLMIESLDKVEKIIGDKASNKQEIFEELYLRDRTP